MNSEASLDAIDTRSVFEAYAAVAWVAGLGLCGFGNLVFQAPLEGFPYSGGVAARIAGAVVFGMGILAHATAGTADEGSRRRALGWWGAAHALVALGTGVQVGAVVGLDRVAWGGLALLGSMLFAAAFFLFSRATVDGMAVPSPYQRHDSLLETGRRSPAQRLRPSYEEQIRAAASQEERHRLACDLHDSIKQQLFVIQTAAATAQARFDGDPPGAGAAIAQVRDSAREAMAEMEAMLDQLRASPLENKGLIEALKKQCEALRFRTGAEVQFSVSELPPSEDLPPGVQQAIFRVAQEALANVGRHARAMHVSVTLNSTPSSVQIRVDDDGVGFETERPAAGMGLANMRARVEPFGGAVAVTSTPGGGTRVQASVPRRTPAEDVDLGVYRNRAMLYGVFALLWSSGLVLHWREPRRLDLAAWSVIMAFNCTLFARSAIAWRRARRAVSSRSEKDGAR